MIEFEVKSKKQHISVNIRDRPKANTVCRQWYAQELQTVTSSLTTIMRRCSSTTILATWAAVVTSPTTTEAKDGKMPKNPFIMDEIVISAPKSKNVNPNNDNNETDNK